MVDGADGVNAEPGAGDDEPGQPGIPVEWAVDTALGAASAASRVAVAFSRSAPGRLLSDAAKAVAAPLTREGHEVRDRAAPAAQEVLSTVTPEVVGAIDLNVVLSAIDLNALLADVDIAAILDKVDVDEIVARVDVEQVVGRVDIDAIVARVDIASLLDRVDIEAILDRIDLNELVSRIDVDRLIQETELGAIIASSTTGVASEALDAVRRQGVSLDNVVARVAARVVRRDPDALPAGPPLLVGPQATAGELPAGDPVEASEADSPGKDAP